MDAAGQPPAPEPSLRVLLSQMVQRCSTHAMQLQLELHLEVQPLPMCPVNHGSPQLASRHAMQAFAGYHAAFSTAVPAIVGQAQIGRPAGQTCSAMASEIGHL